MVLIKKFLIFAICVTVAESIRCFTCDNDSCGRAQGYAMEDCGDHVNKCYTLRNFNSQIYRVGCLPTNCNDIQRKQGDTCIPCDSSNCNGILMANPPIGSGTTFNSATTLSSSNAIIFAIFSSFTAIFIYA